MSLATAPVDGPGATPAPAPPLMSVPSESCPLCGAPLHPEQEWCLRCGAAARTRLAASPNWRTPLLGAIVVAVLSLGVLAAALVKLAGDTGPAPPPSTMTVTSTTPAAALPAPTATVPSTPTTSTATPLTPGASTPRTPPASTTPPGTAGATPPNSATTPAKAKPKGITGLGPALTKRLRELIRRQARKGK